MGIRFAEKLQVVPIYVPAATTATDLETYHVKAKNANWISFLCTWGAITTDAGDGTIKVYSTPLATTANATEQAFSYRLSAAVGTDNWGDITAVDSTGSAPIGEATDNMCMLIDVDPASVVAADADAEYVHLLIDGSNLGTNPAFGAVAILEPRYPQNENLTSS